MSIALAFQTEEERVMGYSLQRANVWKRISAWLFDLILAAIVAVLCAWGLTVVTGFDTQYNRLIARYDVILENNQLSREDLSTMAYSELTAEEKAAVEKANAALAADREAVHAYQMVTQMMVMIISISILLAHLILEFAIPLKFRHGRTLGKKIFGIAVMRSEGVEIQHVGLFIRTILGKYAVETMLPVMAIAMFLIGTLDIVALAVVVIVLVAQAGLFLCTHKHTLIHDLLADTVVVDFASQKIFPTREALLAYKKAEHARKVEESGF